MGFDLGQFLADSGVKPDTKTEKQIELISLDLIVPNEKNFYSVEGIDGLANSILLCGLQQPLLVRQMPGDESQVVIISGHRRYTALKKLVEEGHEELRDVPCIVEQTADEPDALTELKLILANSDTRKISSADMATQVEKIEKLLYDLQQQGYSFPGRMRDHVSQICKVSAGKISNLKTIKNGLFPHMKRLWERGELSDAAALILAKQPMDTQRLIWVNQIAGGKDKLHMPADKAEKIISEIERVEKLAKKTACTKLFTSQCSHVYTRREKAAAIYQSWLSLNCTGCCCTCWSLKTCNYSCEHAEPEKQALKKSDRDAQAKRKAEQKEADASKVDLTAKVYSRVRPMRLEKNISPTDFIKASTDCAVFGKDLEKLDNLELGRKVGAMERLPGGIWPDEALRLIAVADMLDCSIDYLLGRTDTPKPAEVTVTPEGWHTGNPPEPMWCICRIITAPGHNPLYMKQWWNGGRWQALTAASVITHWMPEVEE